MDPVLAQRLVVEQQMVALQSEMASQGAGLMGTYSGDFTTTPVPGGSTSNFASPTKLSSAGGGTAKTEKETLMLERNRGLHSSPGVSSFKSPGGDSKARGVSWVAEGREADSRNLDAQTSQTRGQGSLSADVAGEFGVYAEAGRGVGGSGDGSGGGGGAEGLGSAALEALERMADRGRGTRIQGLSVDLTPYVNTSAFMVSRCPGSEGPGGPIYVHACAQGLGERLKSHGRNLKGCAP